MSENPFATPEIVSGSPKVSQKAPGGLTALLIICLVLGILGLLMSCLSGAALAFQGPLQEMQQGMGDPAQQAMQKEIQSTQEPYIIPSLIMVGLNFIVAPLLTIGAIGGLNRKPWGHKLLGIGLVLAIFYVVVKSVLTIIMQVMTMGPIAKITEKAMAEQGAAGGPQAQTAEMMGGLVQAIGIGAIIYVAVSGLILLGFYVWGWMYLRKEAVMNYFGVA
jgi:hypothetical protein